MQDDLQDEPKLTPGNTAVSRWKSEVEALDNPSRYSGEYLDAETGYYYLRARYYDPQIQRFISEDSFAKSPSRDEHVYGYVEYNPVLCFLRGKNKNMVNSNESV